MSLVLVLNNSNAPLHICNWRRAVALIVKDRAEVVEHNGKLVAPDFPLPLVIRLRSQVYVPYAPVSVNRANILARDKHTCQYCGCSRDLTLDHVMPRSRGGKSTWENLVAACERCNTRKGNQTPAEAGMRLNSTPVRPRNRMSFLISKHQRTQSQSNECWSRYLLG